VHRALRVPARKKARELALEWPQVFRLKSHQISIAFKIEPVSPLHFGDQQGSRSCNSRDASSSTRTGTKAPIPRVVCAAYLPTRLSASSRPPRRARRRSQLWLRRYRHRLPSDRRTVQTADRPSAPARALSWRCSDRDRAARRRDPTRLRPCWRCSPISALARCARSRLRARGAALYEDKAYQRAVSCVILKLTCLMTRWVARSSSCRGTCARRGAQLAVLVSHRHPAGAADVVDSHVDPGIGQVGRDQRAARRDVANAIPRSPPSSSGSRSMSLSRREGRCSKPSGRRR